MKAAALEQFRIWFDSASQAGITQPNAMALATTGVDGRPAVRMVLLSSFDDRGFVFHTNYTSHKAQHITDNPWVALVFYWEAIGRQVRIEGHVEKTSASESDAYFATRLRGSQLGAWASAQSQPLKHREQLDAQLRAVEIQFEHQSVPRPPHWGGYRVIPRIIEYWTARDNRLHDRLVYEQTPSGIWQSRLLAP